MFSDRERNESATTDISPSCPEKWRKEGIESSKPEEKVPLLKREKEDKEEKKFLLRWKMCQDGDFRKRNFFVPCHPSWWLSMAEKCLLQRKKFNLWTEKTQKRN
ncbi:hypothetical protein NPIL_417851 [Nephila pilipes]|uniref:Uncharacterized protein n=1 Tax=Nephila pilipes TaxID=299642 RepID=A0A8X6TEK0_NEPPI|nr:hypothetical protein NPIL_417851 [Nephila pilipes]